MKKINLSKLANVLQAYKSLPDGHEWKERHLLTIQEIEASLPRGAGLDKGCTINILKSHRNRIVIETSYHHMNEQLGYDGWTDHKAVIIPDLINGFIINITGRDKNDIKNFLGQIFDEVFIASEPPVSLPERLYQVYDKDGEEAGLIKVTLDGSVDTGVLDARVQVNTDNEFRDADEPSIEGIIERLAVLGISAERAFVEGINV